MAKTFNEETLHTIEYGKISQNMAKNGKSEKQNQQKPTTTNYLVMSN